MRRLVCAALFLSSAFLVAQTSQPRTSTKAPTAAEAAQRSPSAELPVRRVVLYKNGVGYFEHAGRVTGNQAVTIDFTSSQLNDVLQSLTALDLGGGRITGVGYNSTTPLDQQLKNIPLGLDDQPTTEDLYGALRGARVEVSGEGGGVVAGRVVNYETRSEKTSSGDTVERAYLTIVSDAGAVRTFEVTGGTSVRVLDGGLRRDLDEYLALLASTQGQQVRHLTLQSQGTGTRDIKVSYISEVPVWKSTYRIVFPDAAKSGTAASGLETAILQGWAVVDNTVGSDWNNVQLSLVAGAPQSFIEPLSQPIYTQRPEVPVPEAANVAPTTHEGAVDAAPSAAPVASSTQSVTVNAEAVQLETERAIGRLKTSTGVAGRGYGSGSSSHGTGGGFAGGMYHAAAALQDESASATSSKFDDFFEYSVSQPITIHKNESALVPVLQTNVQADRVTLYNANDPAPLRALWLTNSGNVTLDRGSFSIFDNGEFAGEGLMDPVHAGEKRLLSYAVDQAVHVTTEGHRNSSQLRHVTIHDGVLTERVEDVRDVTYVVHNAAPDARTVVVEYPVENGWTLTSEVKPAETSASFYRFSVAAKAGDTVRLQVGEAHTDAIRYQIADMQDSMLEFIVNNPSPKPWHQVLAPVLAARTKVHDLDMQIDANQKDMDRLGADQKRLHDNLAGLKDSAEERALARRYAGEMNSDEDQLDALKKRRVDLDQQRKAAAQALNDAIGKLDVDLDV